MLLCLSLVIPPGYCQNALVNTARQDKPYMSVLPYMPAPDKVLNTSQWFDPVMLKGLKIYADEPFKFDFIFDPGDEKLSDEEFQAKAQQSIGYFLAGLTLKDEDLWVNLSPYEETRVAGGKLEQTDLGKDMLAMDYVLKQLAASLTYPETTLGKQYWDKVRAVSGANADTYNKVWIAPDKVSLYQGKDKVYIDQATLKVMLEEDYLAMQKNQQTVGANGVGPIQNGRTPSAPTTAASQITRELIIPRITEEVNRGMSFAHLRQIYNALLLSYWFKLKLKQSVLGQVYAGKEKLRGVEVNDPNIKEKIYNQYLEAFKKGAYNYIKKEKDPGKFLPTFRKYYSGGIVVARNDAERLLSPGTNPRAVTIMEGADAVPLYKQARSIVMTEELTLAGSPQEVAAKKADAEAVLGRTIDQEQAEGLWRLHNIGTGELGEYDPISKTYSKSALNPYTREDIWDRARGLRALGFVDANEREKLIKGGVVGMKSGLRRLVIAGVMALNMLSLASGQTQYSAQDRAYFLEMAKMFQGAGYISTKVDLGTQPTENLALMVKSANDAMNAGAKTHNDQLAKDMTQAGLWSADRAIYDADGKVTREFQDALAEYNAARQAKTDTQNAAQEANKNSFIASLSKAAGETGYGGPTYTTRRIKGGVEYVIHPDFKRFLASKQKTAEIENARVTAHNAAAVEYNAKLTADLRDNAQKLNGQTMPSSQEKALSDADKAQIDRLLDTGTAEDYNKAQEIYSNAVNAYNAAVGAANTKASETNSQNLEQLRKALEQNKKTNQPKQLMWNLPMPGEYPMFAGEGAAPVQYSASDRAYYLDAAKLYQQSGYISAKTNLNALTTGKLAQLVQAANDAMSASAREHNDQLAREMAQSGFWIMDQPIYGPDGNVTRAFQDALDKYNADRQALAAEDNQMNQAVRDRFIAKMQAKADSVGYKGPLYTTQKQADGSTIYQMSAGLRRALSAAENNRKATELTPFMVELRAKAKEVGFRYTSDSQLYQATAGADGLVTYTASQALQDAVARANAVDSTRVAATNATGAQYNAKITADLRVQAQGLNSQTMPASQEKALSDPDKARIDSLLGTGEPNDYATAQEIYNNAVNIYNTAVNAANAASELLKKENLQNLRKALEQNNKAAKPQQLMMDNNMIRALEIMTLNSQPGTFVPAEEFFPGAGVDLARAAAAVINDNMKDQRSTAVLAVDTVDGMIYFSFQQAGGAAGMEGFEQRERRIRAGPNAGAASSEVKYQARFQNERWDFTVTDTQIRINSPLWTAQFPRNGNAESQIRALIIQRYSTQMAIPETQIMVTRQGVGGLDLNAAKADMSITGNEVVFDLPQGQFSIDPDAVAGLSCRILEVKQGGRI